MEERPDIVAVRTGAELRRWYWLKEELVQLAQSRGVRTSGAKRTLTDRLAAHLDGLPESVGLPPTSARGSAGPQLEPPLSRESVIPAGQRSSQALRGFFEREIGPGFRFDGPMRAFISAGAGRTLGDAVDHWYATRDRAPSQIAPQFELNRFIRAWHAEHPTGTREEALAAWRAHRALPRDAREAPLSFRFATEVDVPAIVALVESAYRGDSSRAGWTTEADLLHGQRTDEAMVAGALGRPGAHVLLAMAGPELVGCCELTEPSGERDAKASGQERGADDGALLAADQRETEAPPVAMHVPHGCSPESATASAAYLGMFAVSPVLQGAGIGRSVLDEAARIARDDWGAATLELTTIVQREDLIAWYERRGFHRTGELRPFPYGEPRYGHPQRDDLEQVVLARPL